MKIEIITGKKDIDDVQELLKKSEIKDLYKERYNRNVKVSSLIFSKEDFWKTIVGCLLSSQQNSETVEKFLALDPLPLSLDLCLEKEVKEYTKESLLDFGGIRYYNRIGQFLDENLNWLELGGGWHNIAEEAEKLAKLRIREPMWEDIEIERTAANFMINNNLKGFGPKQSRNFWQELGYTRYEIPLDSRVMKWLNSNSIFPVKITSIALSDVYYYEMVLDWIQRLCKDANILPCMLDAAIFSS